MQIKCIETLEVSGRTVYRKGEYYDFKRVFNGDELVSREISSPFGLGIFMVGDPAFDKHFTVEEIEDKDQDDNEDMFHPVDEYDFEEEEDEDEYEEEEEEVVEKPKKMGKLLSFFKRR